MGNTIVSSQWYIYGKRNFTATGYKNAVKAYKSPQLLDKLDLSDRVYMVTGANSGLGKSITEYLASKNATVHMVCRSKERGEKAWNEIRETSKNDKVHLLLADMSLTADVRRVVKEFEDKGGDRLDGLVCNAGALLNKKTLTAEGLETTFACHLLGGTYLLSKLCFPFLRKAADPRVVVVSSGGMLTTKFPSWAVATGQEGKYNGAMQYAYAKRGQVLLAERWAEDPSLTGIKFLSCHPGWVDTPGVDAALADQKPYLQPLRSPWEGAEGICWLCVAPSQELENGAFYLDRTPSRKHIAGAFFSEGSRTKNPRAEVDFMMRKLEMWSELSQPEREAAEQKEKERLASKPKGPLKPLQCVPKIDLNAVMGKWYVIASIPTRFERGAFNAVETYKLEKDGTIDIDFKFHQGAFDGPVKSVPQKGFVHNTESNSEWRVQPVWPIKLPYLIIDCKEDSHVVVGYPSRAYVWIMARTPVMQPELYTELVEKLETTHQYDLTHLEKVPQKWEEDGNQGAEENPVEDKPAEKGASE